MEKKAVVEIELKNEVQVFSESVSGTLDFEGAFTAEEADRRGAEAAARKLLAGDFPRVELPCPDDDFGSPLYWLDETAGRSRVYARFRPETRRVSEAAIGFSARYPSFVAALRAGAFGTAGRIVDRSRKLAAFRPLLRYLAADRAFPAFALYWLGEFDGQKYAALESLLAGRATVQAWRGGARDPTQDIEPCDTTIAPSYGTRTPVQDWRCNACAERLPPYRGAFELARSAIAARDLSEFEDECREKLRTLLLDRKEPLVLAVVGTRFRPSVNKLSARISSAREEAFRQALLEGKSEEEATRRIRDFMEGIQVLLVAEPSNPHDPNAVSILLRFPDCRTEQAGYVKREIAAILSPMIREGATFSGRVYKLYGGEADVHVQAR